MLAALSTDARRPVLESQRPCQAALTMHPSIRALFHDRGAVRAGELQEILSAKRISSLIRDGHLHRPWHGVYTLPNPTVEIQLRALDLVADAHVPVCMGTAAASYGFDTERDGALHVINPVPGQLRPRPNLVVHQRLGAPLRYVDGRLTTAPDWTAIEIARTLRPSRAIGTLDAALRSGHCSPGGLRHAARMQAGRRGIVHVRDLLTHADGRSESPMESETRLLFIDSGVPAPELQATICDRYGTVWRVDSCGVQPASSANTTATSGIAVRQPCAGTNSKRRAYKNAAGRSFLSPSTTFGVIGTSLSHESIPICVTTPREHAQMCRMSAYLGTFGHVRR